MWLKIYLKIQNKICMTMPDTTHVIQKGIQPSRQRSFPPLLYFANSNPCKEKTQ